MSGLETQEGSPAADEAKRQAVILAFTIAGAVLLAWVTVLERDAMARTRLGMRVTLSVKRFAQWHSDVWADVALKAGTAYNRMRP